MFGMPWTCYYFGFKNLATINVYLFSGTFAAEKKEEKVAYGLVTNINTFDPIYIQVLLIENLESGLEID
jgi:hypothetical protein